jgi:hypothetical protein
MKIAQFLDGVVAARGNHVITHYLASLEMANPWSVGLFVKIGTK